MATPSFVGGSDEANANIINNASLQLQEGNDPDKVEVLEELEDIQNSNPVYQPCSVSINAVSNANGSNSLKQLPLDGAVVNNIKTPNTSNGNGNDNEAQSAHTKPSPSLKQTEKSKSSWSLPRMFRNPLLACCACRQVPENEEESSDGGGIELQNLIEPGSSLPVLNMEKNELKTTGIAIEDPKPGIQGTLPAIAISSPSAASAYPNQTIGLSPVWTLDCSTVSVESALENLKTGGVKLHTLVVRNSPVQPIMVILEESLVTENITRISFENCDISLEGICKFLVKLTNLDQLDITMQRAICPRNGESVTFEDCLAENSASACGNKDFVQNIVRHFEDSMKHHPQRLKLLNISLPMIWQCGLVCRTIEALMDNLKLENITIKSSLKDMLLYLLSPENSFKIEDESTWQTLVGLECKKLLERSRDSLKSLTLSCSDTFPLEYMKISKAGICVDAILRWCFFCTLGTLQSLSEETFVFPRLEGVDLDLPFVPVPMEREDEFRRPLNIIMDFLAKNNHLQKVKVLGLRPVKGMENWIKHSLVSIPRFAAKVGATYSSTSLHNNMPTYDDELISMAVTIVPGDIKQRVSEIIEPYGKARTSLSWSYNGMRSLHIINQQPALISFDVGRITSKFHRLTKLVLEDFAIRFDEEGNLVGENGILGAREIDTCVSRIRSLGDLDIRPIFKHLTDLEYLHLDCNMTGVTDYGIIGIREGFWGRLTSRGMGYSFWTLYKLKYLYLRGLGPKVTDKSACHAFSEDFALKNLREMHVFAPGFTNYGKDKIRRAYQDRNGFILEL